MASVQKTPPMCPNCFRHMILSHVFYAVEDGPLLSHFHCRHCGVGITEAEDDTKHRKGISSQSELS